MIAIVKMLNTVEMMTITIVVIRKMTTTGMTTTPAIKKRPRPGL
jgi:hypothetical protein